MVSNAALVPGDLIETRIKMLREQKVMLSADLASLYGVEARVLVQAVKRNIERFPDDFMFQLSDDEFKKLKAHDEAATWGGLRKPPYAFTEQGVAMLSSVLRSKRAVRVNVEIMRAFVRIRKLAASYSQLLEKIDALEDKYDTQFKAVFDAIRQLMAPPAPNCKQVGFHWEQARSINKKSSQKKPEKKPARR